jgi:hypothetical protein
MKPTVWHGAPCKQAWAGAEEARPKWNCSTNCCMKGGDRYPLSACLECGADNAPWRLISLPLSGRKICDICLSSAALDLNPRPCTVGDDMAEIMERWDEVIAAHPEPTLAQVAQIIGITPRRAVSAVRYLRRLGMAKWENVGLETWRVNLCA